MIWSKNTTFIETPFTKESELEAAILKVKDQLFGPRRIYLDIKKKIGTRQTKNNIPDGYLLDLSGKQPVLYVVENEIALHEPIKHIAVQLLEFSLAFDASPKKVKHIVKDALMANPTNLSLCNEYIKLYNFQNLDYLLERAIESADSFNALVIIDELDESLESVLSRSFRFPAEVITLRRFRSSKGETMYEFEPFLMDVNPSASIPIASAGTKSIDISEIDTIIVPAHAEGAQETFIGENQWYAVRIHSTMLNRIKYIAMYQVSPISAITHYAEVASIAQYKDTNKYIITFKSAAKEIGPLKLVTNGKVKALQSPRYATYLNLKTAKSLDDIFP